MFVILGNKWMYKDVPDGVTVDRHCPECGTVRKFREMKPTEFFTLFFIPVLKVAEKKPVLECLSCRTRFAIASGEPKPE